ncbi:MAG: GtrA family protein [Kiritimatiellia bacterium]
MNFVNTVRRRSGRLIRFGCSSVCVLAVKIGLLWLFERYTSPRTAYGLTHIGIFLVSYFLHSVFTFKQDPGFRGLIAFFKAVAVIKLLDYVLFAALITYVPESLLVATAVTGVTFVLRFFIMRASFQKQGKENGSQKGSQDPPSASSRF